jgi:hypothetical protein
MIALRPLALGFLCAAAAGVFLTPGHAADPAEPSPPAAAPAAPPAPLVVHEWGTFTSFSGSDGVPVGFRPTNTDLPSFVYYQDGDPTSKSGRLYRDGTVSMETPVIYFYADRPMRVGVKVDFPRGWITEWFPFATNAPSSRGRDSRSPSQSIRWDVTLMPGERVRFPRDKQPNHYYHARETDAVPVQAEVPQRDDQRDTALRGGTLVQREGFLFYRGVGTFQPPATVKAIGGGNVRVRNNLTTRLTGLVLVNVRGGKVGFAPLSDLEPGGDLPAIIPEPAGNRSALAEALVERLTGAGLYGREAHAMVKTWDAAWFGEEGTRLLYLVPRSRTDELLPLSVEPKPTEVVRVLVGRHDFITPEQEADAERQVERVRAARAELDDAEQRLQKLGRFSVEARQMATKRLETRAGSRR